MTVPITPQYLANAVTVQSLYLVFKPTWDGTDWVVDPASVEVHAEVLLVDGENPALSQTKVFLYNDLPAPVQMAVDDARVLFEQQAADTF